MPTALKTKTLILGAGYSGLTAAAILANQGEEVLVLEAHSSLGGCAGFFRRGGHTFDVGATTFSGLLTGQPSARVFSELGIEPNVVQQDPGVVIVRGDRSVRRWADTTRWINELEAAVPDADHRTIWKSLERVELQAWALVNNIRSFPPTSLSDIAALINPRAIAGARLLPQLLTSVARHLPASYKRNALLMAILDEQLLISTQSTTAKAPFLIGALGLMYPKSTFYPVGGMFRPALLLQRKAVDCGAQVLFRRRVVQVVQRGNRWVVHTDGGQEVVADRVVSSIPIWNMMHYTSGNVQRWFQKYSRRFSHCWGAFVVYAVIDTSVALPTTYYQVHVAGHHLVHSHSVFCSFSLPNDTQKTVEGTTTLTISTHVHPQQWIGLNHARYAEQKHQLGTWILEQVMRSIPELDNARVVHSEFGSPMTWQRYTQRYNGFVGGIPHSTALPMLLMPPNRTPFPGLWMIGDSVFPGQGTPAVMLGGYNVAHTILETL
jgi:C-3',4' desaturase CrtD